MLLGLALAGGADAGVDVGPDAGPALLPVLLGGFLVPVEASLRPAEPVAPPSGLAGAEALPTGCFLVGTSGVLGCFP